MDELLVGVEKELTEGDAGHDDQATHKVVIHKHFPLAFKAKSEFEEKLMRLTQDAPEVISHTFCSVSFIKWIRLASLVLP